MKPVARGVNSALKKPGLLQKLVDSVSGLVPLEKIKKTLKTTLYPQYQKACGVVAPHMQTFGGVAGAKIIEFLQVPSPCPAAGFASFHPDVCWIKMVARGRVLVLVCERERERER